MTLPDEEIRSLPHRQYAEKHHRQIGESDHWGHHPSPEAIGGYYGIAWYAVFEDPETGERYNVHCTDGVYGGSGPFREEALTDADASTTQEAP